MTIEEYQKDSRKTASYKDKIIYPALGLCSESGEVAGRIKKMLRDDNGILNDEKRRELVKELGDVLWYVSQLATDCGLDLGTIASENLKKLLSRLERGKIGGSGDDR